MSDEIWDNHYDKLYAMKRERYNKEYSKIIAEFDNLTIEESVLKLIQKYADTVASRHLK